MLIYKHLYQLLIKPVSMQRVQSAARPAQMLNISVELHEHRTSANQEITTTVQNQQINEPTTRLGVKATTCKAKAKAKDKDLTFKAKAKDLIPKHKVGYQNKYNLPLCQNLIVHIF